MLLGATSRGQRIDNAGLTGAFRLATRPQRAPVLFWGVSASNLNPDPSTPRLRQEEKGGVKKKKTPRLVRPKVETQDPRP